MPSGETVNLYDRNDKLVDTLMLPPHYMEDAEVRSVMVEGKKYVEGGIGSFYGKGNFAEVVE